MKIFPLNFRLSFLNGENSGRVVCFATVAIVHILLLCFLGFDIDAPSLTADPPPMVLKLTDIQEYSPPPPPPPVSRPVQNAVDPIAEKLIEVEEIDDPEPPVEAAAPETGTAAGVGPDYLPQHKISLEPAFDTKELKKRIVYPPIARRSGIEGTVYLELFIDQEGYVRHIIVLKETPEGRGFAEAAVKGFQGMRAQRPAQANGEDVAVRYRWPVRFTLK
jgi:protein TonB